MDIMKSQSNMTWINMPHHNLFFKIMDCNFLTTFCDENIHYDFKLLVLFVFGLEFLSKTFLNYSPSSHMFHIPYLYMIHQCIYTLHTLMHAYHQGFM
jgi:hypothetical protein